MPDNLRFIEVENFKSYKGRQVIGPLKPFTAVIGPNGSGKSNFMDAISFVLGEKTSNLRVKKLSELIHGASIGHPVSNTASVTLVYEDSDTGRQTRFCRYVVGSSSDYKIDNNPVSKQDYANKLETLGINVKPKNFLVYQGANDYKEDYVNRKVRMDRSEEELHHMYVKKKGIAAERKEAVGEINEAKKYQQLKEDLNKLQVELQFFKLYHIQKDIDDLQKDLGKKREELNKHVKKKEAVEEEIKNKKQNHNKLMKQLAQIDKQIRE
ncbi:structural maintenance of chromosomes protein 1A-like protein 2, partial [Dinothrombium tinctorium]